MEFESLMQKAIVAVKMVGDIKKVVDAMGTALSDTEIGDLRAKLDEIHPVTMQIGEDLDKKLELAEKLAAEPE